MEHRIATFAFVLLSCISVADEDTRLGSIPQSTQRIPVVPAESLTEAQWRQFTPISPSQLEQLLNDYRVNVAERDPTVATAEYTATFGDKELAGGQVVLDFSEEAAAAEVKLGRTNLDRLQLFDGTEKVPLALSRRGGLVPLTSSEVGSLSGTWRADGTRRGRSVIFDLQLPVAEVARLTLKTLPDVVVKSPNALVQVSRQKGRFLYWELIPNDPSLLTIDCVTTPEDREDVAFVSVTSEVRLLDDDAEVTWRVVAPKVLLSAIARFRVRGDARIERVQMGDVDLLWRLTGAEESEHLEVELPDQLNGPLYVYGAFSASGMNRFDVPFLIPASFRIEDGPEGVLQTRTAVIRTTLSAGAAIESLRYRGMYEKDVSYQADGSQVLEFQQYLPDLSLSMLVSRSRPFVQDDVVVIVESQDTVVAATAHVQLRSRSGSVSELSWRVPANWRVTDVRETGVNGAPLLFRVSVGGPQQMSNLQVSLRQPMSPGSQPQRIQIRMQADGTLISQQQPAALVAGSYIRTSDFVAIPAFAAVPLIDSWSSGPLPAETIATDLSWLEPDVFDGVDVYYRSDLTVQDQGGSRNNEVQAHLEYSVSGRNQTVSEIVSIRISSDSDLPGEIPLTISGATRPELIDGSESINLQQAAGADESNWLLTLGASASASRSVSFLLVNRRRLTDVSEAMVVSLDNCIQTGLIQPPPKDAGFSLSLVDEGQNEVLASPTEYPFGAFSLILENLRHQQDRALVSGRAFVVIDRELRDPKAFGLCRCLVRSDGRSVLHFRSSSPDVDVYVDGKRVHADGAAGEFQVPILSGDLPIAVDIFLNNIPITHRNIRFPALEFVNSDSEIDWYVLSTRHQLDVFGSGSGQVDHRVHSASAVRDLILDTGSDEIQSSRVKAFAARWAVHSFRHDECHHIPAHQASDVSALSLRFPVPDWVWSVCWGALAFISWQLSHAFSTYRCGVILIVVSVAGVIFSHPALTGVIVGTALFACVRIARSVSGSLFRWLVIWIRRQWKPAITLLVMSVSVSRAAGQILNGPPSMFSVESPGSTPVVYIRQTLLDQFNRTSQQKSSELAVVETRVDITLQSEEAGVARVRSLVAGFRDESRSLILPSRGVTLVESHVNGVRVFPRNLSPGEVAVEIAAESELPSMPLGNGPPVGSSGPRTIGRRLLHEIEYDVRLSVTRRGAQLMLDIPLPDSPVANVTFHDPAGLVSTLSIPASRAESGALVTYDSDSLPKFSNVDRIELNCALKRVPSGPQSPARDATITSVVEVLPDRLQLSSEYRVKAQEGESKSLHLNVPSEQVINVRSESGPLAWKALGDGITVTPVSAENDELVFVVKQEIATLLALKKTVDVSRIRSINGLPASEMTLVFRTADQFILQEILGDSRPMSPAPTPLDPELVRPLERRVTVSPGTQSVSVEITERISTQLVTVSHQAVVNDEAVEWSCICDYEISGQPAFRQVIFLDPSVRVDRVTATLDESDRIQSWSRTERGIVVQLREATRGELLIKMEGVIPRLPSQDTPVPVAEFPLDIEVLLSTMELSSEASAGTFVASFGGTIPDSPFDTMTEIPRSLVRLTVDDDTSPLIVASPTPQFVELDIVALLYESGGQIRVATAVSVVAGDPTAPVRFRSRGSELDSQQPLVSRGRQPAKTSIADGVVTILPARPGERNQRTVVVLPNAIPVTRDNSLFIQTPEFDAPTRVVAVRCLDLGNPAVSRQTGLPRWVMEATAETGVPPAPSGGLRICEFDDDTQRIQVRMPIESQNTNQDSGADNVVYVDCEHHILPTETGYVGDSGFLVFASQSRSSFEIPHASGIDYTRLRINGRTGILDSTERGIRVSLPTAVSHIVIEWIAVSPEGTGWLTYDLPIPETKYKRGQNRICIVSEPQAQGLRFGPSSVPVDQFTERRSTSIMAGLQGLATELPPTVSLPEEDQASLPDNLFSQLRRRSPDAARSLDQFLRRADQRSRLRMSVDESHLQLAEVRTPPLPALFALILGLTLLLLPGVRTFVQRDSVPISEQETVVRERSAESAMDSTQLTVTPDSVAR